MLMKKYGFLLNWLQFALLFLSGAPAWAAPTHLTFLHTNDLHSHFRPEPGPLRLGGIARLKTAIDRVRAENPNTLVMDGGDWSEGTIYYTEGVGGSSALRLMDDLSYDAAVVGNHDWLNGPEILLEGLVQSQPKVALLAANLRLDRYNGADRFRTMVPPYFIKQVGELKIAIIGLLTYEFIFDKYLAPVEITEPFENTKKLSNRLRQEGADLVVVLSHNSIGMNQRILRAAPEVDLIIGAHDHELLTQPVSVARPGKKQAGYVVEAGSHGKFLGRIDLKLEKGQAPQWLDFQVLQMDASIPEDPGILRKVEAMEAAIESRMGPVFHDEIGHNDLMLGALTGVENPIGEFVTDTFRAQTGADAAIDHAQFIYGSLHPGAIRTADVFNVHPGVYNPRTGKSWTVKLVEMKGGNLAWILNFLASWRAFVDSGFFSVSGIDAIVAPQAVLTHSRPYSLDAILQGLGGSLHYPIENVPMGDASSSIQEIRIQGQPLDPNRTYRLAMSGGMVESILFANSVIPRSIPLNQIQDTGIEAWRMLADRIHSLGKIESKALTLGNRIRTLQPDLGFQYEDVKWIAEEHLGDQRWKGRVRVRISNHGVKPNGDRLSSVGLYRNANGQNQVIPARWERLGDERRLRSLRSGDSMDLEWSDVVLREEFGSLPLTVIVEPDPAEHNLGNNQQTVWFPLFK